MLLVSLRVVFMNVSENKKLKREKKKACDEEGTKVPLISHMHFKEGHSFAVP